MKYLPLLVFVVFLTSCSQPPEEKYIGSLQDYPGEKEGTLKSYYENGNLYEEAQYAKGKIDGFRKMYFEDGSGVMIEETYKQGVYDGAYIKRHPNGTIKVRGDYLAGSMEGIWKTYYASGDLKDEVTMHDNLENGPFKEYHENGKIKALGTYIEGEQEHGLLQLFDDSGTLIKKMDCDMGICRTTWTLEKG